MESNIQGMETLTRAREALQAARADFDRAAHVVAEQAAFQGWNKIKLQALAEYQTSRSWYEMCMAHTAEIHDLIMLEREESR